jgi:hypothetical protein
VFCASCTDRRNNEKIEYFLSQPRDTELTGWWSLTSAYWYFKESGTKTVLCRTVYEDGTFKYDYLGYEYYWYTEKTGDGRKIFHYFRPTGWIDNKEEGDEYYAIRNDSLWMSPGLEGDINGSEMQFIGVRCDEPKEYKDAKR